MEWTGKEEEETRSMAANRPTGTVVSLPPEAPAAAAPKPQASSSAVDPESLLDALDGTRYNGVAAVAAADEAGPGPSGDGAPAPAGGRPDFDPIDFLNQHYHTEQQLVTALPGLRSAISARLTTLDGNLSTTLRHQAALSPTLARDVVHARNASSQLVRRVHQVRDQARKSEAAVIEITRDMKRLDHAKRHLQRTITALKRLHMLLHAAEQLRMAAMVTEGQPVPRYGSAAHLVDATRLLLGHFDGYMDSVPKMRQVRDAVGVIKGQLWEGIVKLFKEVGFQQQSMIRAEESPADGEGGDPEGGEDGRRDVGFPSAPQPPSVMVRKTLADACLVVEALGPKSRERFVTDFISDHLAEYDELYNPMPTARKGRPAADGAGQKSFKKSPKKDGAGGKGGGPASLDGVEERFAYFRDKLRSLQTTFEGVFPPGWNVQYRLTYTFLGMTARHLKFVLKKYYNKNTIRISPFTKPDGPSSGGGSSGTFDLSTIKLGASTHGGSGGASQSAHGGGGANEDGERAVTALLKALQKTILFEKEMTAWLTRDFGARFADPDDGGGRGAAGGDAGEAQANDDGDDLEFDERGRAVAAKSAEGIKIKYERRRRAAAAAAKSQHSRGGGGGSGRDAVPGAAASAGSSAGGSVQPLAGLASTTFDDHMSPYVSLEERSMDEQLHEAAGDDTVDTRGERPVFVSSTNLFIYMKNSITRCTALTREKTFYLLQRAFQKKLRAYASVLEKKLPPAIPQSSNVVAKMTGAAGSGSDSNAVYRIPPGEEVTVCHVIDTCEYCADTVEALEDLIRDRIGSAYKEKIDMGEEQGAFQDVTARCVRVLVSGLEQRLDAALRDISRTNWGAFDEVGEESPYVATVHRTVHPFVAKVRELIPSSYFRSFCDKFALSFIGTYYRTLVGLKRISEAGTQQLLLDVYSIKTLVLKLPVLEAEKKSALAPGGKVSRPGCASTNLSGGSTIAPAMYTKMVNKEFRRLEVMLKLVGSPRELLVDMFRAQWDCSIDTSAVAADFATVLGLKGVPRADQPAMLEALGLDAAEGAAAGAADASGFQALQERGSDVAAKVNADLNQMRQRVDVFRKTYTTRF